MTRESSTWVCLQKDVPLEAIESYLFGDMAENMGEIMH